MGISILFAGSQHTTGWAVLVVIKGSPPPSPQNKAPYHRMRQSVDMTFTKRWASLVRLFEQIDGGSAWFRFISQGFVLPSIIYVLSFVSFVPSFQQGLPKLLLLFGFVVPVSFRFLLLTSLSSVFLKTHLPKPAFSLFGSPLWSIVVMAPKG